MTMESELEATLRLKEGEIADLKYEISQLRRNFPDKPWRWVKKYEMACGEYHWCLESIPQPDNGVGDGLDRTIGLILLDNWSDKPTPLMIHILEKMNASK